MTRSVAIINGPNLNMLGEREPDIYGKSSFEDLERLCLKKAGELGMDVICRQSNHEGELVSWVQMAGKKHDGLVINAGAYTHTSVALLDALLASAVPAVEVHLSNIYQRDHFRHNSYIAKASCGMVCGFGAFGYELALQALANIFKMTETNCKTTEKK